MSDEPVGFSSNGNSFHSADGAGKRLFGEDLVAVQQPDDQSAVGLAASPERAAVDFAGVECSSAAVPVRPTRRCDSIILHCSPFSGFSVDVGDLAPSRQVAKPGQRSASSCGKRRQSFVQRLPVERGDLEVAELRLRGPGADAGPSARGSLAVVGVVDDQVVVEPDLDPRPFAAGADAIPAIRFDLPVVTPRDRAPAILPLDAPFQGMADVAPAAQVGPVELLACSRLAAGSETLPCRRSCVPRR